MFFTGLVSFLLVSQTVGDQDRLPQITCEDLPKLEERLRPPLELAEKALQTQVRLGIRAALNHTTDDERVELQFRYDGIRTAVQTIISDTVYQDPNEELRLILKDGFEFELVFYPYEAKLASTVRFDFHLKNFGGVYLHRLRLLENAPALPILISGHAIPTHDPTAQTVTPEYLTAVLDHFSFHTGVSARQDSSGDLVLESSEAFELKAAGGVFSEERSEIKVTSPVLDHATTQIGTLDDADDSFYSLKVAQAQLRDRIYKLDQMIWMCATEDL